MHRQITANADGSLTLTFDDQTLVIPAETPEVDRPAIIAEFFATPEA